MAFGIEIISKLFLSLFRIAAVIFIGYYLYKIVHRPFKRGYVVCIALILAGAFGNIIDSVFYGVIFDNPTPPFVATLFPEGGGYQSLFHGKVVDMLYSGSIGLIGFLLSEEILSNFFDRFLI